MMMNNFHQYLLISFSWKKGTYKLNKEPVGFKNDDLLIGVGRGAYIQARKYESTEELITHHLYVGFRDLVTAVDVSHEHIINKQTTKDHTFSISNGDYRQDNDTNSVYEGTLITFFFHYLILGYVLALLGLHKSS